MVSTADIKIMFVQFQVYMAAKLYESAFVCATALKDASLVQQIFDVKEIPRKMALACKRYLESDQQPAADQQQPRTADNRPGDW